jgi:hypothetical protein
MKVVLPDTATTRTSTLLVPL